jgi:hypothetical protein
MKSPLLMNQTTNGFMKSKRNTSSIVLDDEQPDTAHNKSAMHAVGTPNTVKNTLMAAKTRHANFTPGKFWENA